MLAGSGARAVLDSLDGTRDRAQVLAAAAAAGVDPEAAGRVLDLLVARGVLDDAATHAGPLRELPLAERDRLEADVAAASLRSGEPDGGMSNLLRRRRASVHVYGAGRVGATTASLLAAAGVGHVRPIDPEPARQADTAPAGVGCADVGTRRDRAAEAALRRCAPITRSDHPAPPDLAVLTPARGASLELPDTLSQQRVPHLLATVREAIGVVGPLVLPGMSACVRCQHAHRCDRDAAWPRLAAQLDASRQDGDCAVVLATSVAALAANQALSYLDRLEDPGRGRDDPEIAQTAGDCLPVLNGSLELADPGWRWRRRSWPLHPRCGCRWEGADSS